VEGRAARDLPHEKLAARLDGIADVSSRLCYVAPDAAQLLAEAGVQLVGIDYISAEQFGAPAPRAHWILLGKGIPIVEGLALAAVPAGESDLIVLPMKVAGHEGAPARAVVRKRAP
jgi:arylformamidase